MLAIVVINPDVLFLFHVPSKESFCLYKSSFYKITKVSCMLFKLMI